MSNIDPTFKEVSEINLDRALIWHKGGLNEWSETDWMTALAGECGEAGEAILDVVIGKLAMDSKLGLIANAVKKLRRHQGGIKQAASPNDLKPLMDAIATEIGDTYLYMDLLVQRLGLDLYSDCIRPTFNRVSQREGFTHRI